MQFLFRRVLPILAVGLGVVLAFQIASFLQFQSASEQRARALAADTLDQFSGEVETLLSEVETLAGELSRELSERHDPAATDGPGIKALIRNSAMGLDAVTGVTVCFEPYAYSPETRLHCPYFSKSSESFIQVEDSYDYAVRGSGTAWYGDVIDNGAAWTEPYFAQAAQEWLIDYGTPFRGEGPSGAEETIGVVDISVGTGDLQNIIHTLSAGRTSASFILSPDGAFLSHPTADLVGTETIEQLLATDGLSEADRDAMVRINSAPSGQVFVTDQMGREAYLYWKTLPDSGFKIAAEFDHSEMLANAKPRNRRFILLALTLTALVLCSAAAWFGRDGLDVPEVRGLSITATVLLASVALLIGVLQHGLEASGLEHGLEPVTEATQIDARIGQAAEQAERRRVDEPTPVPTALYIERMEAADSYNFNVSGLAWQKYPVSIADDVEIGFRLPQTSPFAEAELLEETSRQRVNGAVGQEDFLLVSYVFRTTLRLDLSYRDFPFDKRHLIIDVLPVSPTDNILLVPDLVSYSATNPRSLPGIDPDIRLPGSVFEETYFTMSDRRLGANLGIPGTQGFDSRPVLHYNIRMKRLLMNAFVSYLIPIAVVLAMIYILIMASAKTSERQGIIESMAAFLFVLVFSQIDLRKDVKTAELIFIEYFYFITYFMIILSTFNLISYTKSRVSYFDWGDNAVFRAAYFPVFFGLLVIAMLYQFY